MSNKPNQNLPDDINIEKLLAEFSPKPSSRFYTLMSTAPWQAQKPNNKLWLSKYPHLERKHLFPVAALILLLIITIFTFTLSVRVAASQIIHFFLPVSSNQLEVTVNPLNPQDILDFSNPSSYLLSINAAQDQAGYPLKQISPVPEGMHFSGARFEEGYNAVILLYAADNYQLFLTQRPAKGGQDVFSIGSQAQIEYVQIGAVQGEYVRGGWHAYATQSAPSEQTTTGSQEINAVWDNELTQSTLRWQSGGMVYELRSNGEGIPSQSDLITWANRLK
jgi:hypothetical protein